MLKDPLLESKVYSNIFNKHQNVQLALKNAVDEILEIFENMNNDYPLERGDDLQDIGNRLICVLRGVQQPDAVFSDEPVVVVARNLAPTQVAAMDMETVLGFATDQGSCTSHTAIVAQGLGIPSVMGCVNLYDKVQDGDVIVVDGHAGVVVICPDGAELDAYRLKQKNLVTARQELSTIQYHAIKTKDGRHIQLGVNISSPADLDRLAGLQAGSVGLLRSEMLFMGSASPPTEEEQLSLYRKAVQAMDGRPVTIRTLDVGGDKRLPWPDGQKTENPFLGHRGIRLSLQHEKLFRTQLRAILRAGSFGQVRMLFPMVSTPEETAQCLTLLKQCQQQLMAEGLPFDRKMNVGIMIETPSAVIMAEELARMVDFFSIGTNDLTQYLLAADRTDPLASGPYSSYHPAVVRSIWWVVNAAHKAGRWCGICGTMASDRAALELLVGLGLDELSILPDSLDRFARALHECEFQDCLALAEQAIGAGTLENVTRLLPNFSQPIPDVLQAGATG